MSDTAYLVTLSDDGTPVPIATLLDAGAARALVDLLRSHKGTRVELDWPATKLTVAVPHDPGFGLVEVPLIATTEEPEARELPR